MRRLLLTTVTFIAIASSALAQPMTLIKIVDGDTFYFKDAITKGELAEEAFHAVISTILTPSQKAEFYKEAIRITPGINARINQLLKDAPETYSPLTDVGRKERVAEEYGKPSSGPYEELRMSSASKI